MLILHQLALDLMNKESAFSPYSNTMTEESCFVISRNNNETSFCRLICYKKKFVALFTGDLDAAAKMCELCQEYPIESGGRLVSAIVSVFLDGLIGFFFARKHREDEVKWTDLGINAIQTLKKWVKSSDWNFSNKLYLLEAEFYFLKKEDERALVSYHASINAAREYKFIHEEGLAEEKIASYLLQKNRHYQGMKHLINAKKCYEVWGAHTLVQRVEKAIAIIEHNHLQP